MSGYSHVFKNVAWISIGQLVSKAFRAVFIVLAARVIGVTEYGIATYVLAHIGLFSVLADCGLAVFVTRECARGTPQEQEHYIRTGLTLKLLLVSIVMVLLFIAIITSTTEIALSNGVVIVTLIIFMCDSFKDFSAGVMIGREKTKTEALINLSTSALLIVVGIPLMYMQKDALRLLMVYAAGSLFAIMLEAIVLYRSKLITRSKVFLKDMKEMLRSSYIFGLQSGFMILVFSFDAIMIGWILNEHALGIYGAAQKLPLLLNMIPGFITQGFLPELARSARKDSEHFSRILTKSITFIAFVGLPLFVGGELVAPELIPALFGGEYAESITIFRILLGMNIFAFFAGILTTALYAHDKQNMVVKSTAAGAALSIIGNCLLIPVWGIIGSAIASVIAQAVMFGILLYDIRTIQHVTLKMEKIVIPLCVGLIAMSTVTYMLLQFKVSVIIVICAAALTYTLILFKSIKKVITT